VPCFENPTILITRPAADADRFLAMLRAEAGSFEASICPAFGFEEIPLNAPRFDAAVFTSRAGVSFAPAGEGRTAYCVGDSTAQMAQDAGYTCASANGSAEELVALILEQSPAGSLHHIRGEISRGNITERLVAQGINCTAVIAYRKVPHAPRANITEALRGASNLIIPLFSAETVSIIASWGVTLEGHVVVAISAEVAEAAQALTPVETLVSEQPNMRGMAAATARLIA
jgi:uroporphyrinogen-III synthase